MYLNTYHQSMLHVLKTKEANFLALDPFWQIDNNLFVNLAKESGTKKLQGKVTALMPTIKATILVTKTLQQIQALMGTALYKFCIVSAQGQVATVSEMLTCILHGKEPRFPDRGASPWLVSIRASLIFYCSVTDTHGTVTKIGNEALAHHFQYVEKTPSATLTCKDMEMVTIFRWLLRKEDADICNAKLLDVQKRTLGRSVAVAQAQPVLGANVRGAVVKQERNVREAMNMFG